MESLDFEELKNIVRRLLSETSCPVCFNTLSSPVRLCTNGHGVCAACRPALEHCPLCREPFSASSSKNVLLNGMLDRLPHTCKFEGCEVFVKPGDDHEIWCGNQRSVCKLRSCVWTGLGKDTHDHIKTNHVWMIISKMKSNWSCTKDYLGKMRYYVNTPNGSADDSFCWMITTVDDSSKTFVVKFIFVPNGNVIKTSFRMTLVLGDSTKSYSASLTMTPDTIKQSYKSRMDFAHDSVNGLANSEGSIPVSLTMVLCRQM